MECDLDQYHGAPKQGWPSWIADKIFDDERFILVIASPSYLRRWLLAERDSVGLGAKYEGRFIRQVLYSEEGLNWRVIPVVMEPNDKSHIPPELCDTTRYDVRPAAGDVGYDKLLRRLTAQPELTAPTVGDPVKLLDRQSASLAEVFYVLQRVPAPFPIEILRRTTGMTRQSLLMAAEGNPGPPILNWHEGDLLTTTYYRPIHPLPLSDELLSRALDALLAQIGQRESRATTRDEIRNTLELAGTKGVRQDLVGRVFGITHKAIKRLGDKRLVWRATELSLAAVRREKRHEEDAKQEALILICGRSWVLQRVNRLDEAMTDAKQSLELGNILKWHRNTAFCLKCVGRLSRMQAEAVPDGAKKQEFLAESERYLRQAIKAFTQLDEHDCEEEVGECHSFLGRTLLVAGRLKEAQDEAGKARSRLHDPAGKEYLDLQILHGDLAIRHNPPLAESLYSEVIQQCEDGDAQYSEIRARALYARGRCRQVQRRGSEAKEDFNMANEIWTSLQDPLASLAEWGTLTCEGRLPIDQQLLESETPAVRVRVIRNHQERLRSFSSRPARRKASVERNYLDQLIADARLQVAIEDIEWVSRITDTKE